MGHMISHMICHMIWHIIKNIYITYKSENFKVFSASLWDAWRKMDEYDFTILSDSLISDPNFRREVFSNARSETQIY